MCLSYVSSGKVKCWCYCLFGRLEAWATGILLDVLLAHSFVLYSNSHSGGLASGAICLSSTLRIYWCLAIKYHICWEVSKGRWATVVVIKLGHTDTQSLLFLYTTVCVHTYACASWDSAWQSIWFDHFSPEYVCVWPCTYACASCVSVYLILLFFSSVVGNSKSPNLILHSPFPNCSDTLMR